MRMLAALIIAMLAFGCAQRSQGSADPSLAGSWRIYSEEISYDYGGSNTIAPVNRTLELSADGTWSFGASSGTWRVANITAADWNKWYVSPYGPKRKIVLDGWDGYGADGPIEETGGRPDFFWAMYRPKDQNDFPGIVMMKFGRS